MTNFYIQGEERCDDNIDYGLGKLVAIAIGGQNYGNGDLGYEDNDFRKGR